jgi:hypothetical protein
LTDLHVLGCAKKRKKLMMKSVAQPQRERTQAQGSTTTLEHPATE